MSSNLETELNAYLSTVVKLYQHHQIKLGQSADVYPTELKIKFMDELNVRMGGVDTIVEGFGGEGKMPLFTMEDTESKVTEKVISMLTDVPNSYDLLLSVEMIKALILKHGDKEAATILAYVFITKAFESLV